MQVAHNIERPLTTSNGHGTAKEMQGTLDSAGSRWREYFKWERLTVAGRNIEKGWVVPQPLGIALIVVMLSGVGGLYWKIIDKQNAQDNAFTERFDKQNEMLIRLDQRLIDKNTHDAEFKRKQEEKQEIQDLQIQDLKDRLLVINTKRR